MTHLDSMDVDITIPEYSKKLKLKLPVQLVEKYDFGSDWDESMKLGEAMKMVKEPKLKGGNE